MSLNPHLEQDFWQMIPKLQRLVILARRGAGEAMDGKRAAIEATLREMIGTLEALNDTTEIAVDTMDTFTDGKG